VSRRHYTSFIDDSARWDRIALRDGDIVIDTPAKSGTTWMQMCVALLVFQQPDPPRPMAEISPWIDMLTWPIDELVALLDAQTHRRFVKTHTPLDGVPWDPRLTYICVGRDPRDVMVSWQNHMANIDFQALIVARIKAVGHEDLDASGLGPPSADDPAERFRHWVEERAPEAERQPGLAGVLEHLQTFWDRRDEPNVALFHYADLKADLPGQLRRLADVLAIDVPEARLDELVHAATFDEMKRRADHLAPDTTHGIWQDTAQFFDKGTSGRWRDFVGDDDLAAYEARVAELVPPDLARWAHRGWLGA
jgi:hypothetical protein